MISLFISVLLMARVAVAVAWWWGAIPYSFWMFGGLVVVDGVFLWGAAYSWWRYRRWYGCWAAILFAVSAVSGIFWIAGYKGSATASLGTGCMLLSFVLGHWLIRGLLSPGVPLLGIARTLIDEAVRMKVVLALILGLLLLVPAMPFMLDPNELLKYRIQFFLTWSLSGCTVLLSLMTLLLACGTVCNEISRGHIYLTLTKPIGRGQYLLGKWLGIVLLDLLLIMVVGIGLYVFSKVLEMQPERNEQDRLAVETQIFAARETIQAEPPETMDTAAIFEKHLEVLRVEDPHRYERDRLSLEDRRGIERAIVAKWHTIPPLGTQRYLFSDVYPDKPSSQWVQLRLKPVSSISPPDSRVRLALWLNGRPYPLDPDTGRHRPIVVTNNKYYTVDLPVSAIDQSGKLVVRIDNVNLGNPRATFPSSISFAPGRGLEMLYQVGRFEPNLVRALLLVWLRLGFVAMLGLAVGSVLDFPVACLLGVLVYITAGAHGYLVESMQYYVQIPTGGLSWWDKLMWLPGEFFRRLIAGELWGAIKVVIRLVGNGFVLMVPSLSDYNPAPLIADGRLVRYQTLASATLWVGAVWTSLCALIGWLLLRRRELARVTV